MDQERGALPDVRGLFPSWHARALCAQEPYDRWSWVIEPSNGRESARSAVKLLQELRFDIYGCFGGTMRSERHHVMTALDAGRTEDVMQYADTRGELVELAFEALFDTLPLRLKGWRHMAELEAAERERTAPERARCQLERRQVKRAGSRNTSDATTGSCRTCYRPFTWATRSDARFCRGRCRQAAYRNRAAAA